MSNQVEQVRALITGNAALMKVVSETMTPERFTEAAVALFQNPAIASCTPESVLGCLLKAAIFGFRLSPELGQCWIVPRSMALKGGDGKDLLDAQGKKQWVKQATFQIGYKGWMDLAYRSGEVESFDSGVVRPGDVFEYEKGSNPFLKYRAFDGKAKPTHVWASATMRSGRVVFNVVDADEIERHRRMSDTQKEGGNIANNPVGIWAQHWDAMAKRIPMRYLCTMQLPKSELIQRAIEADGSLTEVTPHEVVETTPNQVHELAPVVELHEDYLAEIEACRTKDALKGLYAERKAHIAPDLLPAYYERVTAHAKTLQQ